MSFKWVSLFRRGSWMSFRKFVLEEARDFEGRLQEIQRQLDLIGEVTVFYKTDEETGEVTQERTGFSVTFGSSLYKLVSAYTLTGGNPLNISLFLNPRSYLLVEEDRWSDQPMGGAVSPLSGNPMQEVFLGGWSPLDKHYFWKVGKQEIPLEPRLTTTSIIGSLRKSILKEIKTKRIRLEEKIIKLCDLREKLLEERDFLKMSKGLTTEISFTNTHQVGYFDKVLFQLEEKNKHNADPKKKRTTDPSKLQEQDWDVDNDEDVAIRTFLINVFEDAESEKNWIISDL